MSVSVHGKPPGRPLLLVGYFFTTGTTGRHDTVIAVPNDVNLLGIWTYWQSIVVDAGAPTALGITLSDAFEAKIGDYTYIQ